MTFFQFARNNVWYNGRAYAAYFLSSTFAILLFFLYATLSNHPDLHKGYINQNVMNGMQVAQGIICVFSFFSILYSMGSFLRGRNKEFGIFTILGISPQQLLWLVFLENMLLGLASILVGTGVGLILSQLFLLLGSSLLDIPSLPFYVPTQALLLTCTTFLMLFALVSVVTLFFMRTTTVLTLLTGSRQPKPEPQASPLFALLAATLLIVGYAIATNYRVYDGSHQGVTTPVLVIVLIACGTYLLYGQLSVFVLQFLKKRRNYSWHGTHLLWLSELTYHMKENARLFFAIAMLLSVTFTATDGLMVLKAEATQEVQAGRTLLSPFAFSLMEDQSHSTSLPTAKTAINQVLDAAHLSYTTIQVPSIVLQYGDSLISQSNYNRLAVAVQFPRLVVQPSTAIAFPYRLKSIAPTNTYPATLPREQGKGSIQVMPPKAPGVLDNEFLSGDLFVLTDQDYQNQSVHAQHGLYVFYTMAQWKATTQIATDLQSKMKAIEENAEIGTNFSYQSRAVTYYETYQLPNITSFIGLFTALIFLIASGSFLYFRLYTTLNENRERYRTLSKIGLSEAQMRRSVTIQVITLFFAPFLIAILNTVFVMVVIKNNDALIAAGTPVVLPTVGTVGFFLALQAIYCSIVRAQYLSQVKQVLV